MELAETGAGKNDENHVAAAADILGSAAAGIGSVAVAADGRLAVAEASAVAIAAAEVVAAAPPSVAAATVVAPAVAVGIVSVPVGNIVAPDDDYAALAVAFVAQTAAGELFAVAAAALSLAAGNRTAAEPAGPPFACCWTGS